MRPTFPPGNLVRPCFEGQERRRDTRLWRLAVSGLLYSLAMVVAERVYLAVTSLPVACRSPESLERLEPGCASVSGE